MTRFRSVWPPPPLSFPSLQLDTAAAPKAFYNLVVVKNPTSVVPSTLANRTVTMPLPGATFVYVFDSTGVSGVVTVTPVSGETFGGPFQTYDAFTGSFIPPAMGVHTIVMGIYSEATTAFYLDIGCDSTTDTTIVCRHKSKYFDVGSSSWRTVNGNITISR